MQGPRLFFLHSLSPSSFHSLRSARGKRNNTVVHTGCVCNCSTCTCAAVAIEVKFNLPFVRLLELSADSAAGYFYDAHGQTNFQYPLFRDKLAGKRHAALSTEFQNKNKSALEQDFSTFFAVSTERGFWLIQHPSVAVPLPSQSEAVHRAYVFQFRR